MKLHFVTVGTACQTIVKKKKGAKDSKFKVVPYIDICSKWQSNWAKSLNFSGYLSTSHTQYYPGILSTIAVKNFVSEENVFCDCIFFGKQKMSTQPFRKPERHESRAFPLTVTAVVLLQNVTACDTDFPHDYSQFLVHKRKQRHNEGLSQA